MDKQLQDYLYNKYPVLFSNNTKSMQETCMCWGIATGNGWALLIDKLCNQITNYIKNQHENVDWYNKYEKEHKENGVERPKSAMEKIPEVKFDQLKEKFSTLRVYYSGGNENIRGMVDFAESLSGRICEECGKFDNTVGKTTKGWIHTICKSCNKDEDNGWELLASNDEISKVLSKIKKKTEAEEFKEMVDMVDEVKKRSKK